MTEFTGANVTIMVTSMDQALAFYVDTLGLELKARYGDHWADISGPGISIGLHPTHAEITVGENLQIGLRVTDIQAAMADLGSRGVRFSVPEDEQVNLASFQDPDGNTLYLVQTQF